MKVSLNFLVRIAGMLFLAFLGSDIGMALSESSEMPPSQTQLLATQLLMLAGAGLGLLVTPRLTIEPIQELLNHTRSLPLSEILFVAIGGVFGLLVGVLFTFPLSLLPAPFNQYLPLITAIVFAYMGAMMFVLHKRTSLPEIYRVWRRLNWPVANPSFGQSWSQGYYLVDTSAIIDGRIATIGKTGFLEGTLLVPQFVLFELQTLADSSDDLRRSKGRRGLDLLNQMQKNPSLPVEVVDVNVDSIPRVDDKLVMVARQYQCPIITNDFNLNRVAELQGVKVLSLNKLSDAIRPPVVQDQHIEVQIRSEGNARQQGVGYLDDGTPVIVEDARDLIGETVQAVVTRLHQTQTGRLVFAQLAPTPPPEPRSGKRKSSSR
jgi:uncharacterized protein YacL